MKIDLTSSQKKNQIEPFLPEKKGISFLVTFFEWLNNLRPKIQFKATSQSVIFDPTFYGDVENGNRHQITLKFNFVISGGMFIKTIALHNERELRFYWMLCCLNFYIWIYCI